MTKQGDGGEGYQESEEDMERKGGEEVEGRKEAEMEKGQHKGNKGAGEGRGRDVKIHMVHEDCTFTFIVGH